MLKKLLLISLIFSSTIYAIQNPELFGKAYNLKTNADTNYSRPQEFGRHVPTPENFKSEATGHNWAVLSWESNSTSSSNTLSFHIYRNGILLTELPANQQTYKDKFLQQQATYRYEIFALDKSGWSSQRRSISLMTKKNAKPVFTHAQSSLQLRAIRGIGLKIHVFRAMDTDGDPLYFKVKNKDYEKFMINQNTGELVNRKYLVRDNQYRFTVEVSDGMNKSEIDVVLNT